MSKESFKLFARNHKELANTVIKGNVTWQQLYELYEIYGEDSNIWNSYFDNNDISISFKELFNTIKNIDMESVQKGITNIQKAIGLLQDLGINNKKSNETQPIYKRFED